MASGTGLRTEKKESQAGHGASACSQRRVQPTEGHQLPGGCFFSLFFSLLLSYPFCAKVYFLYINSNLSGIVTGFQFLTGSGRSVMWGWATQGKSLTVALDLESSVNPRWSCSLGPVCPKGAESGSSQEGSPMNLERGHQ